MPRQYDDIINELAKDPEFLDLDEQEQDQLVEELAQERFGTIPKSGNLLERAINSATQFGNELNAVPESFFSSATFGAPQMIEAATNKMMPLPPEGEEKYQRMLHPETSGIGTALGTGLGIFKGAPAAIAKSGAQAVGKGLTSTFGEKAARRTFADQIFKSHGTVKGHIDSLFKQQSVKFGAGLKDIKSTMKADDFANILAESADDLNVSQIPGHPLTREFERMLELGNKELSGPEVQAFAKNIQRRLGSDEPAKAIFFKKFLDKIPDTAPGMKELRAEYAQLYPKAKQAKMFTKTALSRAGKGTMGPEELGSMKTAEKNIGVNVLEGLIKSGKKVESTKRNKTIATGAAGLTGAGLGANFLSKLISGQ